MTIITKNGRNIAVVEQEIKINSTQDLLDVFVSVRYELDAGDMIIYKESLCEEFFDLSTRIAGEFLQKCSNYQIRLAVVGDFSHYASNSLKDFIYESNKGSQVFFKSDLESAVKALTGNA